MDALILSPKWALLLLTSLLFLFKKPLLFSFFEKKYKCKRAFTFLICFSILSLSNNSSVFGQAACTTSVGNVGTAGQAMDGTEAPFTQSPNCPLVDEDDADAHRGFMIGCNQSGCPVTTVAPIIPPTPSLTCPIEFVEYNTIALNTGDKVYVQYWNNCIDGVSGFVDANFTRQGFINQLFCMTDGLGYPSVPAIHGTPLSGPVSALPAAGEDIISLMQEIDSDFNMTFCNDPDPRNDFNRQAELLQADFWFVIPSNLTSVGFKVGGERADAALFMVGPDVNDMCATSELIHTSANGVNFEGLDEVYYEIPDGASISCGGTVLRGRFYLTDIAGNFRAFPEVNIGSGFTRIDELDGASVIPATGPSDNTIPTPVLSASLSDGFLDNNGNIFDLDGVYVPLSCAANTLDLFTMTSSDQGPLCDDPTVIDLEDFNNHMGTNSYTYTTSSMDASISGSMLSVVPPAMIPDPFVITVTASGPTSLPASLRCETDIMLSFLSCITAPDSDMDGVEDSIDKDDDNDGILDVNETGPCGLTSIFTGYQGVLYDGISGQNSFGIADATASFPTTGFTQIATFDYNEFANSSNGYNIIFGENPFSISTSTDGDVSNYVGSTIPNDGVDTDRNL